ncbi:MAG: MerR family transcriptional regulator [Acidobacteriota bacterium]|nr:MerR family transcriptional regulator [Acidobacteriota bacterium]
MPTMADGHDDRQPKYPIRAVSKLTGVSIDTLRAWERRYRAVAPSRDERGRLYSEADVLRLRLLQRAVTSGHSIGRLASLSDAALQQLAGAQPAAAAPAPAMLTLDHAAFTAALARFDSVAVDRELARLAGVMAPDHLLCDVLLPTLHAVGSDWNGRRGGIAYEHMTSAAMRHLLGSFLRFYAPPEAAVRLLFATPAGDRHEIGILAAAMLTASRGLGVSYVGADLPADQIVEAVRAAGASVLVLGVTLSENPALEGELETIVRDLPAGVELWSGGPAAESHSRLLSTRGLVFADLDAYAGQLGRLGTIGQPLLR